MKYGYTPKWVHRKKMITHFSEVFKDVNLKKTSLRNLLFVILAVAVAKTFRINAIAARLPIVVKKEKSKQKRLLRFLETPLPLDALMEAWCLFVCRWVWKPRTQDYFYVLIDETDLPNGWKALVAAIPSVITLIKDTLMETWTSQALLTSLDDSRCRGDTCLATY